MVVQIVLLFSAFVALANGHGHLKEPIARTSIQHRPEFNTHQPYWWDNNGVQCGYTNQDAGYSTCGRCGDARGESTANQGGIYDKGVIVATYQAGAVVTMEADFSATHYGHFEFELCPQQQETDNCFQKLQVVSATTEVRLGTRVCQPKGDGGRDTIRANVRLPAGVRCARCTIRWTYRTAYRGRPDWEFCDNPYETQTFRNCADVKIV